MKTITGKVISTKMQNTVVVEVTKLVPHAKYGKRVRKTRRFHADNQLQVSEGDTVLLVEIRPISKTKNWKVNEVLKKHGTA